MTSKPRFVLAAGIALSGIVLAGCGNSALGQSSAPASSGSASTGSGSSAAPVTAPSSVNPGGPMGKAGGTAAGSATSAAECPARQLRISQRLLELLKVFHGDQNRGRAPVHGHGHAFVVVVHAADKFGKVRLGLT
jgi:hypothetical protein